MQINLLTTAKKKTAPRGAPRHRSHKQRLEVKAGEDRTITLKNPTPIYGGIDISSTPIDAEVIIDGVSMASVNGEMTPNYGLTFSQRLGKSRSWLYGSAMVSPDLGVTETEYDSNNGEYHYVLTGESKTMRISGIIGYSYDLPIARLGVYAGVGYGFRRHYWECVNGEGLEVETVSGLSYEAGVRYGITNRLFLSVGLQSISSGGRESGILDEYNEWYGGEYPLSEWSSSYSELKIGLGFAF